MDKEFKPNEKIEPIEIETPETPVSSEVTQPADVKSTDESFRSTQAMQSSERPQLMLDTKPVVEMPKYKPIKRHTNKIFVVIMIILLLASVAASAAYWWRDKTANDIEKQQATTIANLQRTATKLLDKLTAANNGCILGIEETACTPIAPSATVIESIKSSITSGNTAALEGYMASSIDYYVDNGDSGPSTPAQAVANITKSIATATSPWNFALSSSVLAKYSAGDHAKYFPSIAVVGQSTNGRIISFSFDCSGKIDAVFKA